MKKDCFAYKENERKVFCKALDEMSCEKGGCSFYKTKEQQNNGIKETHTKLAALDNITQKYIADKYYKGKYPWKESK